MNNGEWYIINDLISFVDATRVLVFNNFGKKDDSDKRADDIMEPVPENEIEEFNRVLSHDESTLIAKEVLRKQTNKITSSERYLVNDKLYHKLINRLNERMVGNILNNLVNKGLVETAFDTESNDFIFWCKENEDLPETD